MRKQNGTLAMSSALSVRVALGALVALAARTAVAADEALSVAASRSRVLLDGEWLFHRGEVASREEASSPGFDGQGWSRVRVPHDYVIEGTYVRPAAEADARKARVARSHAYLPLEPAWYRRRLFIPESARGKVLRLDFDGVFRDSEVWLNGKYLGRHPSGYTPFSYDISAIAKPGEENMLVVRVDPRDVEGWWYEGGGIYRHVWLNMLDPLHVAQWGTYVIATVPGGDAGASAEADLTIQTTLENNGAAAAKCDVVSEIIAPDGGVAATIKTKAVEVAPGQRDVTEHVIIPRPRLWSIESPQLYELRTTIVRGGRPVDSSTTTFGIRTIRFNANKGFFLNGKRVVIKGLACHQDFAGVGIAVPDSLQAWRVEQIKKAGANAWRAAHNPPSEALLDACDRLSVLVMDENRHFGDKFAQRPSPDAPASDLSELATMIRRDRNHPSVIMWSMGNEGGKIQGTPEGASIMAAMTQVVHRYDTTRPVTYAMNTGWLAARGIADTEDILGVNYHPEQYDAIHRRHPDKMMFGSEAMNEKTTRGEYADNSGTGMCSAYHLSDQGWQAVADRPFMAGSFTWTGMDYMGEPNPYGWPDVSNNTGLMDRCGFPKDKFYYFQSCWTERPMVHLVPNSWSWLGREGQSIRVLAFSNARQVELFLNNRSCGVREVPRAGYAEWSVPYTSGRLRAKAMTDGKTVATTELATAGPAARIVLSTDRTTLRADDDDAIVVPVSIFDFDGRVVPDAANRVSFRLAGGGRVLGVGNGNPADHDPEKSENCRAFHGRCIAVVQAGGSPGTMQLTATSPGLDSAEVRIEVR
jgi:beta-galactosidase